MFFSKIFVCMAYLMYNTPMLLFLIYDIVTTIRSLCFSLVHDFGKGDKKQNIVPLFSELSIRFIDSTI
jgi:hypothetical protein